jgi:hypothetical protein
VCSLELLWLVGWRCSRWESEAVAWCSVAYDIRPAGVDVRPSLATCSVANFSFTIALQLTPRMNGGHLMVGWRLAEMELPLWNEGVIASGGRDGSIRCHRR